MSTLLKCKNYILNSLVPIIQGVSISRHSIEHFKIDASSLQDTQKIWKIELCQLFIDIIIYNT